MNKIFFIISVFALIFGSCQNKQAKATKNELSDEKDSVSVEAVPTDTLLSKSNEDWLKQQAKEKMQYDSIISTLSNPVPLDTFLENITCQQRVKVLAELTEKQNRNIYTYSGGGYTFKIKILKLSKFAEKNFFTAMSVFRVMEWVADKD